MIYYYLIGVVIFVSVAVQAKRIRALVTGMSTSFMGLVL